MEARAEEEKPTRSERISRVSEWLASRKIPIKIKVPKKYIDTGLTFDIMKRAGSVDNKILDLAAVEEWQLTLLAQALAKKPLPPAKEILDISRTNSFNRCPYTKYEFLEALDQEIETWVFNQELVVTLLEKLNLEQILALLEQLKNENKTIQEHAHEEYQTQKMLAAIAKEKEEKEKNLNKLKELEPYIERELDSLHVRLDATQNDEEAEEIINKIAALLDKKDSLPEEKDKILLGRRYYRDPDNIVKQINKYGDILKRTTLTDKERRTAQCQFGYWTDALEKWHNSSNNRISRFHHTSAPGLGIGITSIFSPFFFRARIDQPSNDSHSPSTLSPSRRPED